MLSSKAPPVSNEQSSSNKPICNVKTISIITVSACILTGLLIVSVIIFTPKNRSPSISDTPITADWSMEDTAFATGFEGFVFKAINHKTNQIGALKVYLELNDSGKAFQTKKGLTQRGPATKTAAEAFEEEAKALKLTKDCPNIIPLLAASSAFRIEPGQTFTETRVSPAIITQYMSGGSLTDFIPNYASKSQSVSIDILERWNEQMMDAAKCAGKLGVKFTDRNAKNFVLDEQQPPNIYVIDIDWERSGYFTVNREKQNLNHLKYFWRETIFRHKKDTFYGLWTTGSHPMKRVRIDAEDWKVQDFLQKYAN